MKARVFLSNCKSVEILKLTPFLLVSKVRFYYYYLLLLLFVIIILTFM
jgi:hypothetical protein